MNSKSFVRKTIVETSKRAASIVLAAVLLAPALHGQHTAADVPAAAPVSPDQQTSTATAPGSDEEIKRELAAMKKRIEQLEAELKQHEAAERPTTVVQSAKGTTPVAPHPIPAPAEAAAQAVTQPASENTTVANAGKDRTFL